ncbi:MAG: hypothetical protein V3576_03235 [Candidatus Cloacimonadota bacterium]
MQAYNRPSHEYFKLIELGQLTLPKFQRYEAWSHNEITNLLRSMLRGLPTEAALILRVDGEEQLLLFLQDLRSIFATSFI